MDDTDNTATGATLDECWENYRENVGLGDLTDCTFYKATPIEVTQRIVQVIKPVNRDKS